MSVANDPESASIKGVSILGFSPESRAQKAGMQKGDVIIAYDGVGDLTTRRLSALTAVTKPEAIEARVVFVRDSQEHSLSLSSGSLGVSAMDTSIEAPLGREPAVGRLPRIFRVVQKAYLLLAIIAFLATLSALARSWEAEVSAQLFLWGIVYGVIYVGLRSRDGTIVPLILILSSVKCVLLFFHMMQPAGDLKALLGKAISLVFLLFFAYQIYYFRRVEVRRLFGDRGWLIF